MVNVCNVNIYFNKQWLNSNVTPQFAKIKTKNTSPFSKYTKHSLLNVTKIKNKIVKFVSSQMFTSIHTYVLDMYVST